MVTHRNKFRALLVVLIVHACLFAQAADPGTVLIRNVRLIDRDGQAEDAVVSILIKDGKLDVVTKDEIPAAEAALVVDAQNGVLLGQLHVGEPPSFLILDQDPRDDIEVLLDTKTHARFVVHNGEVIKNTLPEAVDVEPTKKAGWLAYTPPPMALPLSYQDETKWNRWEGKYVSGIFVAAVALDRQRWFSQDDASEQQVGDLAGFDGGEIRGLRFGVVGTLNFKKPWVYTVFAATNAFDKGFDSDGSDDFAFFDYRLDIPVGGGTTLSIGKQKEPISMERIMPMPSLPMQERTSIADALLPSRNFGVVVSGTVLDRRMTWAGGAFNDSIVHGESFGEGTSQLIGRLTWLPFLSEDESNLFHIGFGMRYSDAVEGIQTQTEPEFNNAPVFVDSGLFVADEARIYNLEASWRRGPLWVGGEYLATGVDAPLKSGDPDFNGYSVTGSWTLTGEIRPYNRRSGILGTIPVSKSVYQGGWGAWEVGIRWSSLDLTEGTVQGGEMDILSLGLNWWLSPIFNVNLNYRHINLDRFGLNGDAQGLNFRVMLILE